MSWVAGLVMVAAPALAEDPPTRVGSLNYISGEVSYALRGEAGDPGSPDALPWTQADFNQPVCQDMSLKTGAMARARVRIGPDAIQMSGDTWLNVLNLSDRLIEASVRHGRIHLRLSEIEHGEVVELEMPRGSLWLLEPGAYDIDTGVADQPTRIVVFAGKARFIGGQTDLPIAAGDEVEVSGSYPAVVATQRHREEGSPKPPKSAPATQGPASPQPAAPPARPENKTAAESQPAAATQRDQEAAADAPSAPAPPSPDAIAVDGQSGPPGAPAAAAENARGSPDDFLFWVEDSDNNPPPPQQSAQFVSPAATGSEALDRYGSWQTLPDAGPVWFPNSVPDGWAPYRFGHWDSIPPWGWTWIDDQPWGFAPFHYGRWINVDGHWGWVPGAVDPHPVYAPALVAFVDAPDDPGGGPDGPDVGWFPLGPGDDYTPWYAAGPAYVEQVNVVWHGHFRDFAGRDRGGFGRSEWRARYSNRRFATVVSREAFANASRVNRAIRPVSAERLGHMTVMRGAPHVMPAVIRNGEGFGGPHGRPISGAAGAGNLRAGPGAAGAGNLRAGPGGSHSAGPGQPERGRANPTVSSRGNASALATAPGRGGERPQQNSGRSGIGRTSPAPDHGDSRQFARPQGFRNPAQGDHGGGRQLARPPAFQNPPQGYRGNPQQFGRPQGFQNPAQASRGNMPQQFGRPQGFQNPAQASRGNMPQQFGRPQGLQNPAQASRGNVPQLGRPQMFHTPAVSRGGGAVGHAAAPAAARSAPSGGRGSRHK